MKSSVFIVTILLVFTFNKVAASYKLHDYTSRSDPKSPDDNHVITEGEEDSDDDRWKQETTPPYKQVPFDKYFYENVFRYSNIHGILRKHKRLLSSVVDRSDNKCGLTKPYEGMTNTFIIHHSGI